MKKMLLSAALALGLIAPVMGAGMNSAAGAATFAVDVTADPYNAPGQPGLQTRAWQLSNKGAQVFTGTHLDFSLNPGDSFTADVFRLVTFEPTLDADDLIAKASTISFDFGALGSITLLGTTVGVLGNPAGALASYVDGAVKLGGGLKLLVSVGDVFFASNGVSFQPGRLGATPVAATFSLAAVPLPATMPLIGMALAGLGLMARRRKSV